MDELVQRLFISSWEVAKDKFQLNNNDISSIVAVGCDYPSESSDSQIEYLLYPKILDDPEMMIIHILETCCRFIERNVENNNNVLVHCVYGQSRSAAICIAYLLHCGFELVPALDLIKAKHADICINPGFLCQLHLFSQLHNDSHALKVYKLLLSTYGCIDQLAANIVEDNGKKYLCKSCGGFFCSSVDVLDPQQSFTADSILDTYTDSYWSNYRPQSSYNTEVVKYPLSNSTSIVVTPVEWIKDQMKVNSNAKEGELHCPQCSELCGSWRRKCLNVIGPYNLCDLIVLNRKAVKIKRVIN